MFQVNKEGNIVKFYSTNSEGAQNSRGKVSAKLIASAEIEKFLLPRALQVFQPTPSPLYPDPMALEFTPLTNIPRPTLPTRHANPRFTEIHAKIPPVKFQEILREGQSIIVGRLKIATPTHPGHAFILRRYDTGAISLTTMFKAAFPTAPEEYEKAEAAWIRANYDISGANGSAGTDGLPKLRLNGTWIKADLAKHIASAYGLEPILMSLIEAQPDPKTEYRKSVKSATSPEQTSVSVVTATVKDVDAEISSSTKRRRAMSPANTATDASLQSTRVSSRKKTQSPPRSETPGRHDGGSDETAVDRDVDEEPEVLGPDMNQDIQEQQALIADLKAKRDASATVSSQNNRKRRNEEMATPPPSFDLTKPVEVGERRIINRKRLGLEPHQKAAAWGTLAFAVGLGAVSFLPNLFF
ncbi:hypothetical protein Clacol_002775 [Clathrus columnatus]|uniref:HTH APSES-type domain-containing protein n=1 Tax=Clathrus columnatus TaxID=1419009 RepID=A0AAV5A4L1_9AGAM|nr:hypothetical protein Clacol_002775 [Clathrus columnatus]